VGVDVGWAHDVVSADSVDAQVFVLADEVGKSCHDRGWRAVEALKRADLAYGSGGVDVQSAQLSGRWRLREGEGGEEEGKEAGSKKFGRRHLTLILDLRVGWEGEKLWSGCGKQSGDAFGIVRRVQQQVPFDKLRAGSHPAFGRVRNDIVII
jgi:hypothetical protein